MITIFEKYVSLLQGNYQADDLAHNLKISMSTFEKIINSIADWYYDEYHISLMATGSFGSVFTIKGNDDKILKITSDENEAANVSYLVKKSGVKGIVEYDDIHQFDISISNPKKSGVSNLTLYSIIMEKLDPSYTVDWDIFSFVYNNYFDLPNGKSLGSLDYVSKEEIGCSWEEFKKLNPGNFDKFFQDFHDDFIIKKYGEEEVRKFTPIYYQDIMDMIYSSYKYDLPLSDIHAGNIRKVKDSEHVKLIDVGGGYTTKVFKSKSSKININL